MTPATICAALKEARAFVKAAEAVLENVEKLSWGETYTPGRTSGALRRQSMELTRALADMRRP